MKTAVIDIGSNSVRLLVDSGERPANKTVLTTRLGEGLALSGRLSPAAMERTAQAVATLAAEAKTRGAEEIFVFATEAVRSAKNGADFVEMAEALANVSVDVIDGATEARIGFAGACIGTKTPCGLIDVGGASTELVVGRGEEIFYRKSLPVGAVRLRDLCGGDLDKASSLSAEFAARYGKVPPFGRLFGIGGTVTSLAFMRLNLPVYDAKKVHGTVLSMDDLRGLLAYIAGSGDLSMLDEKRAEVIGYGAAELIEVMAALGATEITISETDNLEGYLMYKKL